jgi:hypothetical protein
MIESFCFLQEKKEIHINITASMYIRPTEALYLTLSLSAADLNILLLIDFYFPLFSI